MKKYTSPEVEIIALNVDESLMEGEVTPGTKSMQEE